MQTSANILLIGTEGPGARSIQDSLSSQGISVIPRSDIQDGMDALRKDPYDLVILQDGILNTDAAGVIGGLKKADPDCVILVSGENPDPAALSSLSGLGVYDYLGVPIDKERLNFLVSRGVGLRSLLRGKQKLIQGLKESQDNLQKQNLLLAKRIEDSGKNLSRLYEDLRSTYMRTIKVLAQTIDARDHYTHSHSQSVAKYAVAIAREMNLPAKDVELLSEACELHDLGKIGIEDSILSKPDKLTAQEWEQIRKHPEIGAQILEPLTFLSDVIDLIRQHHERYDGLGYPAGIKGEDILLGARIINVSDAYESMRSARSYRKIPLTREEAILELKRNSGTQFDPKVVEAFLRIVDEL